MTSRLLHEYVALVLEAIRSKKNQKGSFGDKFDLKKFKSLDNYHMMTAYASEFLEKMGQGSSRVAFVLSSKYVLKIAINEKGIAQNQAEVDVYTNPTSQPVVAKVYQSDKDFNWLISDLVKPIKSVNEFEELTGVDWKTFSKYVNDGIKHKSLSNNAPKFIKAVVITALKNNLLRGDLAQQDFSRDPKDDVLDHYGKTVDGRAVLLDYGFTGEVWEKLYKSGREAQTPDNLSASTNRDQKTGKQGKNLANGTISPHAGDSRGVDPYGKTKHQNVASKQSGTRISTHAKTQPANFHKKAAGDDIDRDAKTDR